jgi:hypothetical protein
MGSTTPSRKTLARRLSKSPVAYREARTCAENHASLFGAGSTICWSCHMHRIASSGSTHIRGPSEISERQDRTAAPHNMAWQKGWLGHKLSHSPISPRYMACVFFIFYFLFFYNLIGCFCFAHPWSVFMPGEIGPWATS